MSKPTDYSSEEWNVIASAPISVGLFVSMSDLNGPIGIAKEAMAVARAVNETAAATANELIKGVAEEMKSQGLELDIPELRRESASARTALIYRCKQAVALVRQKSPAEADEYKRWLVSLARRTAEASKEGGFVGIGHMAVSESESSAVRDLALALGVSISEASDGSTSRNDHAASNYRARRRRRC